MLNSIKHVGKYKSVLRRDDDLCHRLWGPPFGMTAETGSLILCSRIHQKEKMFVKSN